MLTLDETGRLVGGFAWVELRLFEVVGSWAPRAADAEVAAHLATQSRHHAAHAETWLAHRPVVAGRDADDLVGPPTPGAEAALAALTGLTGPAGPAPADGVLAEDGDGDGETPALPVVDGLAALYRALMPRLVASYAAHLDAVSPVADPALLRSLRSVTAEAVDDWATGERLLQALLPSATEVGQAAAAQARVESLLVGGGGLTAARGQGEG